MFRNNLSLPVQVGIAITLGISTGPEDFSNGGNTKLNQRERRPGGQVTYENPKNPSPTDHEGLVQVVFLLGVIMQWLLAVPNNRQNRHLGSGLLVSPTVHSQCEWAPPQGKVAA